MSEESLRGIRPDEFSTVASHEGYTRRLLNEVAAGNGMSQRSLARRVGIALGLTNLLVKRVVRKGWVRVIHIKPNRVRYLITPAGIAEKAKLTRDYLQNSIGFYIDARDRVGQRLALLSAEWRFEPGESPRPKRIAFWGAGEIAEIAYVCLPETDLRLVAVVDDQRMRPFFDVPVHPSRMLRPGNVDSIPFQRLVVMSFNQTEETVAGLERLGIPNEQVFWL